jgi:1-acyl-sn-glycerol-3-phosphate acyltransferase
MSREEPRGAIVRRRLVTVPAVVLGGVVLLVLLPIWLPIALIADLVTDHRRLPRTRLLLFALGWTWLESAALVRLGWIWVTGGAHDLGRMTAAQRWWASGLLGALRLTTGLRVQVEGIDAFDPAPVVILARHACLADSLVSAWVVVGPVGRHVRFVIKRELLSDPCLDIAGNRLRNHFVDRDATDAAAELDALRALTADMGADTCAVIFPEGTRANPEKRARALARIAERDPARAERLGALVHLNPPRPAGSEALLAGAPAADVVVAWHTGFDGMDTFGGILRNLPPLSGRTIRYVARRVPRAEVPAGEAFTRWLDDTWLELDREVDAALAQDRSTPST